MQTLNEGRETLVRLVEIARIGDDQEIAAAAAQLGAWTGADWLRTDFVARGRGWGLPVVTGVGNWLGPGLTEPSGFVAAIAGMHADGRVREWVTGLLASRRGPLVAAALAVRCVDHVAQVRDEAVRGVVTASSVEEAAIVVSVLVSASDGRRGAAAALAAYTEALLQEPGGVAAIGALRSAADPTTRRWAVDTSLAHRLMGADEVRATAESTTDQLVRGRCAAWLGANAEPADLVSMLASRHAELRRAALLQVPESRLSADELERQLLDPAARVRRVAQWRARRRDVDSAHVYRSALTEAGTKLVAAALEGLADVGGPTDVEHIASFFAAPSPRVRAAAVAAVSALALDDDVVSMLAPVLFDPSPKVARAASYGLARAGARASVAETAWDASEPGPRRAAWRVHRSSGAWHRVAADLRACADGDERLAALGAAGIRDWLRDGAATTWVTADLDPVRLAALLEHSGLPDDTRRLVALHAGLDAEPYRAARTATGPSELPSDRLPVRGEPLGTRLARAWKRHRG